MQQVLVHWHEWLWAVGALVGAGLLGGIVHRAVFAALGRLARSPESLINTSLVRHVRPPGRIIFPLLAVTLALPALPFPEAAGEMLHHIVSLLLIAATGWLVVALVGVATDMVARHFRVDVADNLKARRVQTQAQVLRRIADVVVWVVTIGLMLLTFPNLRQLGISLFASAGIAGLVMGIAARPALSNLIAGLQLAFTEPIRIDDVVIIEGEWGRIEEIGTTYVIVCIWDLRRLVVPLSYFIERPFENWTRRTADLLGTVFIHADYTVPVEAVREELHRILETSGLWDGKVWGLQVTDADARTLELRALMSAPNSSIAWDLRCHVRERLIAFLQKEYPDALPKGRAIIDRGKTSDAGITPVSDGNEA